MHRFCCILYEICRVIKTYMVLPIDLQIYKLTRNDNLHYKRKKNVKRCKFIDISYLLFIKYNKLIFVLHFIRYESIYSLIEVCQRFEEIFHPEIGTIKWFLSFALYCMSFVNNSVGRGNMGTQ